MNSLQNLLLLQNLYRQQSCGEVFSDAIVVNKQESFSMARSIDELSGIIQQCHLCDLSKSRTQAMSHFGSSSAKVMIIDDFVTMAQDTSGNCFEGRSGDSLTKMVENVLELPITSIFYTHGVKCKPLHSNTPSLSEIKSCKSYLLKQIALVQPKVIIALGEQSYNIVVDDNTPFNSIVGHHIPFLSSTLVAIYHPIYLLKNPSLKPKTLKDLQAIKAIL